MGQTNQTTVKFFSGAQIPIELHKVRVVQKLFLKPIEERLLAIENGGYNTFQLSTKDVFLDMLTDSGTNAMSDNQVSSMLQADDAYAGSQSFYRMEEALREVFGKHYLLPAHQGRAAENIVSQAFIKSGDVIPMNYHFTTTKAHMELNGGTIFEIFTEEALKIKSSFPFKGNIDTNKLNEIIAKYGKERIPFIRFEASTNLIGGQPFSIQNMRDVKKIADEHGIMIVLDASLIGENAYFIKKREEEFKNTPISEILKLMCGFADVVYFSSRKVSSTRGGGICTNNHDLYMKMRELVILYEGFLTYGGMSVREIEAMAVGLRETTDETVISQSPSFIEYAVNEMDKLGIPVITPAGALGAHIDCMGFLPHIPQEEYPAGALAAALFIISGIRGMERGTISSVRDANGNDVLSDMELLRLAFPRRVFTLSQTMYVIDRVNWLFHNRDLVGGLKFVEEPAVLRFFNGRLAPTSDWPQKLIAKFKADFGDSL
ncbi:MAG TPA: tryptophanase [Prolixibacteraceae bacterium]|nr:tryptophanase [Bacteroidales bacterium]HQN94412.1 tryptophanase [Prolixibacteraceae bacterium]HUM89183.1 tryptophanase [Prolixibacteraceae bacterium]